MLFYFDRFIHSVVLSMLLYFPRFHHSNCSVLSMFYTLLYFSTVTVLFYQRARAQTASRIPPTERAAPQAPPTLVQTPPSAQHRGKHTFFIDTINTKYFLKTKVNSGIQRYPAHMSHSPNVGSMLVHRRRHWPNIDPTLGEWLMCAGLSTFNFLDVFTCIQA